MNNTESIPLLQSSSDNVSQRSAEPLDVHEHLMKHRRPSTNKIKFILNTTLISGVCLIMCSLFIIETSEHGTHKNESVAEREQVTGKTDGLVAHYEGNISITFADLAENTLLPWYDASFLGLDDITPDMDPNNVREVRRILLTTRDLLDIFSPVYPTKSNWNELRNYYKEGYEMVGDYQDLAHASIIFSQQLWDTRRQSVLDWKDKFKAYAQSHDIGSFLVGDLDENGCYEHVESHLFWSDSRGQNLPCGSDLATPSLKRLAVVQLNNALDYLATVLRYDNVLEVYRQEEYHNLRKEIRSFLDEYTMFGLLMVPDINPQDEYNIDILTKSRDLLGAINDDWTAYNLYVTSGEYEKLQADLADRIGLEWNHFKDWVYTMNFDSVIRSLLGRMDNQ